jgi:hypothetical protein
MASLVVPLSAEQRGYLREAVRTERRDIKSLMMACGPDIGLKEVVELTQLTVEGVIARTDSALHEDDRGLDEYVYTDYVLDVTRVFRLTADSTSRSTPGATTPSSPPSPFMTEPPTTRPAATAFRVRLRNPYDGRVVVDGGSITNHRMYNSSAFPTLHAGQHVIVSAYFDRQLSDWVPFGLFEVREGRVVSLESHLQTRDFESVEDFTAALANPPLTVVR